VKTSFLSGIGRVLARHLSQASQQSVRGATNTPEVFRSALKKGDVILVEGASRFSVAIKYLTQSTWSHSALYIGDTVDSFDKGEDARVIVEADVQEGIRLMPLSIFYERHTRICRPVGLSKKSIDELVNYAIAREGDRYDLKNIFDLARYLIQRPLVPSNWRRRLLSIGSGEPTRAICSSLVAQAFHSVAYPILPEFSPDETNPSTQNSIQKEYAHIRHHSLFAPGDFDLSPYFDIIKPTIERGFKPDKFEWKDPDAVKADAEE
jgi:cell wall-associated NlpC family hydrolase